MAAVRYAPKGMCGIGGILRVWSHDRRAVALRTPHDQSIPESWLDIIDDSIRHRGPDGHGRFRDRAIRADGCVVDVALVHRRLSIIDHAGGHQPMVLRVPKGALSASAGSSGSSPGGSAGRPTPGRILTPEEVAAQTRRVVAESRADAAAANPELALGAPSSGGHDHVAVVFNGCIYNHRELRAELQRAGHVFSTDHSDTEVLVHGWREWGERVFDRLDGMYAATIWDGAAGEWIIARDPFGEKPLYRLRRHAGTPCTFVVASAAPAVFRLRELVGTEPDRADDDPGYLIRPWVKYGWNQRLTPLPDVGEVVPGCRSVAPEVGAESPRNEAMCVPWLADSLNPDAKPLSAERAERLLGDAVRSRLEADVPLGCFLSGGLDSAIITAMAHRERPGITAYTVRMPDAAYDESVMAAETARAIGVKHTVLDCDPRPTDDLIRLVHQLGLPFGDSSLLPMHWVSRAAGREVKVALAGDGGDEMFLGYDRHRAIPWLSRLSRLPSQTLRALAESLPIGAVGGRRSMRDRLARLVNAAAGDGYKELVAIFPAPLDARLGIARGDQAGFGRMPHFGATRPCDDLEFLWQVSLRFDRMFYLPCDLMRKSDTASMAVPLEVRSPMLQVDLARAAINAPVRDLMPRGSGMGGRKGLLRQVARKHLPAEIVDRPKMGFAIPIGEWFRSDYGGLRTMLLDHLNSTEPFGPPSLGIDLNMNFVRQMLDEHLGTGPSGLVKRDHSQRLYMLLVLSIWAKWLGGLAGSLPRT